MDPPCEKQPNSSLVDGVTQEQKEKLLSRKTQGDMTDEEKWRHIYMILFPDDDIDPIPSPYYEDSDGTELEDCARFFRREMPSVVRRELGSLPGQEFLSRESLLQRLVEIISNMQSRLLNAYHQSMAAAPLYDQGADATQVGYSQGEPRVSGNESDTTTSAPASLTNPTPPLTPHLAVNAEEFANSLMGIDFNDRNFEMDPAKLQRLLDEWGPPDEMVNDGKATK